MAGEKSDLDALGDAARVIDRFGGIRPMSNKMGVPVTTIQGWKKRGIIPPARYSEVLDAAQKNGVDLSDLLQGKSVANENPDSLPITIEGMPPESEKAWHGVKDSARGSDDDLTLEDDDLPDEEEDGEASPDFSSFPDEDSEAGILPDEDSEEDEEDDQEDEEIPLVAPSGTPGFERYRSSAPSGKVSAAPPVSVMKDKPYGDSDLSDLMDKIKTVEVRGGRHMTLIATALVAAALAFVAVIFWPQSQPVSVVRSVLATPSSPSVPLLDQEAHEKPSFSSISNGLTDGVARLDEEARQVKESMESVASQTQKAVSAISDPNAGSLSQRIGTLQAQVQDMGAPASLSDVLSRIKEMSGDIEGQKTLQGAMSALYGIVGGLAGQEGDIVPALEQARAQDPALAQTFSGVAPQDLKAAALLIAFSQFRDTLERGNTPFDKDLSVLLDLVGEDNAPLRESLLRLAPQAEKGILTPSGLSSQFREMAGEAVVSSLQGRDVPFEERAIARLNEVLQVEKNGELITGTDTQAKIARARSALDSGDVEGAVAELEGLEGPAAQTARPWIDEAQAVLVAGEVRQMISALLATNFPHGGAAKYTARSKGFSGLIPQAPVIHDPKSGVLLLPKGAVLPDGPDIPKSPDMQTSP